MDELSEKMNKLTVTDSKYGTHIHNRNTEIVYSSPSVSCYVRDCSQCVATAPASKTSASPTFLSEYNGEGHA